MVQELFISFAVIVLQVISAIVLSAGAIHSGMGLVDRLTHGIDEWKEIKKGNIAIGIFFVSVIVSIILMTDSRITDFVISIRADLPLLFVAKLLLVTFINYLLGLLAGIIVIFLTINITDRITTDLEEFSELKKGNIAVALIFAFTIILIVLAARLPLESAFDALKTLESGFL